MMLSIAALFLFGQAAAVSPPLLRTEGSEALRALPDPFAWEKAMAEVTPEGKSKMRHYHKIALSTANEDNDDGAKHNDSHYPAFVISTTTAQLNGDFTIQQAISPTDVHGRFLDTLGRDVITESVDKIQSQQWVITPVQQGVHPIGLSTTYTMQQKMNMPSGYLDAHERGTFRVVTRGEQSNDSQQWVITPIPNLDNSYTMQQKVKVLPSSRRRNGATEGYVEASGTGNRRRDTMTWKVITGTKLTSSSSTHRRRQQWIIKPSMIKLNGECTIKQIVRQNSRFFDTLGSADSVVTRTVASNSQGPQWVITPVAGTDGWSIVNPIYTMQQKVKLGTIEGYLDAHESDTHSMKVVTRNAQNNPSQQWVITPIPNLANSYTMQQKVKVLGTSRRRNGPNEGYVKANSGYSVMTQAKDNNIDEQWILSGTCVEQATR